MTDEEIREFVYEHVNQVMMNHNERTRKREQCWQRLATTLMTLVTLQQLESGEGGESSKCRIISQLARTAMLSLEKPGTSPRRIIHDLAN